MRILTLIMTTALSISAFAGYEDFLRGKCKLELEGNKSKFKHLRKSSVFVESFEVQAGEKFRIKQNLNRIIPNPTSADKRSLKKNRIVLFGNDSNSIVLTQESSKFKNHKALALKHPVFFGVEYIGKGMFAGHTPGPLVRVQGASVAGVHGENIFKLEDGKKEFMVMITVPFKFDRYRKNSKGEFIKKGVDTHKSKIKLICSVETPEAVDNSDKELVKDKEIQRNSLSSETETIIEN